MPGSARRAFAALLTAGVIAAATAAQAPGGPQTDGAPATEASQYSAPTNLKVLPRDSTGQQVHEIMEQWTAALGTHCDSCHAENPNNPGPDGRPQLDFAGDSKGMKAAARMMYTMTERINVDYLAKIDSSGAPITCGTCHRGHLGPDPFVIAPNGLAAVHGPPPSGEGRSPSTEDANK